MRTIITAAAVAIAALGCSAQQSRIVTGDDDFLLDRNIDFYRAMRDAGIPCQFRVRDGVHDWEYWHSALYECLPFMQRAFYRAANK